MDLLITILLAVAIVLLFIVLIVLFKSRKSDNSNETNDFLRNLEVGQERLDTKIEMITQQSAQSRTQTHEFQKEMREETKEGLREMMQGMQRIEKANIDAQRTTFETLNRSLDAMAQRSIEQSDSQTRRIQNAVAQMSESNEKKLEEMRMTVDEKLTATLTTRLDSSFKTVAGQLENLHQSLGEMKELSTGVTDNVKSLNQVLTNVKARGTWAEVQLENILEQTIPSHMYTKNAAIRPKSQKRVEFAIHIPESGDDSGKYTLLPIDAKFPMEDYIRLSSAAEESDSKAMEEARKALEASILREARNIREYIYVPLTTPFAIMYLATEGLYAEIAASRSGIIEKMMSEYNVMVAGPSTITALLNSLSIGFRAVTINEKANEIHKLLEAIKGQYQKFEGLLTKAKQKVNEAGKALDDAQFRNTQIHKKLRGVDEMGLSESEMMLELDEADEDI